MPRPEDFGIDRLSVEDRLSLVEQIWDSVASSVEAGAVPDTHKALIDARLAAHAADPGAVVTWDEVRAALRREAGAPR